MESGITKLGLKGMDIDIDIDIDIVELQEGDKIQIGPATICILAISKQGVRVGIDAPRNVPVHREEIYNKINREQDNGR